METGEELRYGVADQDLELGKQYRLEFNIDIKDEYIVDDRSMTINGQKATPAYYGTINNKIIDVYKEISKVNIHVNSPAAGKIPAIYPQDVYMVPEGCTVESIIWYENGQLWYLSNGSERFEAGNTYKVEIKIVPTQIGGVNASQFVSPVKSYIDGQEVTERLNWDAVYARSDAVYVYYTFIKSASAPEIGAFVSGSVTREYTVIVGNSSVLQDVKIHLKGDITGDGQINIMDVNRLNLHFKGKSKLW